MCSLQSSGRAIISGPFSSWLIIPEQIVNPSMKDLSCYGIAGRENQTDDLSLTIDMGAPVPTAVHVATRATISECCYDLHGHKLQSPPAKGIYIRAHNKKL